MHLHFAQLKDERVREMESATRVQILDEADCGSLFVNIFEEGINSSSLSTLTSYG